MIAALVDWDLLGQAILSSFVIGLGVLVVAGVAVAASLRAQDSRSDGNETAFIGFSAVIAGVGKRYGTTRSWPTRSTYGPACQR